VAFVALMLVASLVYTVVRVVAYGTVAAAFDIVAGAAFAEFVVALHGAWSCL
jgi:hypothetical protein